MHVKKSGTYSYKCNKMKADEYTNIENLLERFFEGETTNAEEQELYAFFARPDLPEHLKTYRPVFGFFETGIVREVEEGRNPPKPVRKVPFLKRWIGIGGAVAASLLLFLFLNKEDGGKEEEFNPYAGSYIIRGGVKTEIPEAVARELDEVIRQAEKKQYEKERLALRSLRQYEKTMDNIQTKEDEVERFESDVERLERKYKDQ